MLPLLYFVFEISPIHCLIATTSIHFRFKSVHQQGNASMNAAIFRFFFYFSA
ncbi:pheST operon leader peptide PheM [Enterobacteriaceae bacterium ML5]|nr:pheST operon leader peptide PheM [Enterobacteriaceae bacterium ML5]